MEKKQTFIKKKKPNTLTTAINDAKCNSHKACLDSVAVSYSAKND